MERAESERSEGTGPIAHVGGQCLGRGAGGCGRHNNGPPERGTPSFREPVDMLSYAPKEALQM